MAAPAKRDLTTTSDLDRYPYPSQRMPVIARNVVASSLSWDNTYEIVHFTAPTTGTYRLRVNKYRCNYTPKWLGWAWDIL